MMRPELGRSGSPILGLDADMGYQPTGLIRSQRLCEQRWRKQERRHGANNEPPHLCVLHVNSPETLSIAAGLAVPRGPAGRSSGVAPVA